MNNTPGRLKVFIIDDDLAIRQCLKILLTSLYGDKFDIYSSGDGVEGLGMLYILNPDLIIIDTTLPTYSGRELIDYVTSNGRFTNTKLIVVDDRGNLVPGLNPNIKILSKQNPHFVKDLETTVRETLGTGETKRGVLEKIKNFFIRKTLAWANRSDLVMFNISKNRKGGILSFLKTFILFPLWVIAQIITSLGLAFLYLFTSGRIKDANIPQAVSDNKAFRVLAYPTLLGVFTAAVFFIIQIGLFIGGGIVIFNSVRLESIFANNGGEVSLNFNTATYDSNLVELVDGRLRLKEQFTSVEVGEDAPAVFTEEPAPDETVLNQPESDTPTETQPEVIEPTAPEVVQPVENTGEESSGEVQGIVDAAEVVGVSAETISAGYSVANPSITFNESIGFSNLVRIEESSTVNNIAESTPDINSQDTKRSGVSIEDLKNRVFPSNTVTYQLSPNNLDWYYFNANNVVEADNLKEGWEKTEQGFVSSNTVQEVNQYLSNYLEAVGGNTLYLRVYLHSDGSTQVSLNEIKVIREQSIVTLLNEEVTEDLETEEEVASLPITFPVDEETTGVETVIPELPIPTIFQATYVNGNKVVYGKLLGASIPESELQYIKVNVYYTSSTDITKTAEDKLELIGESSLSRNEAGDLTFLLQTPNREGGYVTAELVYVINNVEVTSILSKPLENSTFTVDSTTDTADHTLNGVCSAGTATGGVCTLRAAIAEANFVVGADNIYFNIPTSDSGYRDYDTPDSPSSGDGVGGDDYWTIRPATVLPTIAQATVLDGATQESNQGDLNSMGPDIEIKGHITFTTNSNVNRIVMNGGSYVLTTGSNFTITNSYIGSDVKSALFLIGGGISVNGSNVVIGNTVSDGNTFGLGTGVRIPCTSPFTGIKVQGNRLGMSHDTNTMLTGNSTHAILINGSSSCEVVIGGDTADKRNFITARHARVVAIETAISADIQLEIYNNYFGTDLTGTQRRSLNAANNDYAQWMIYNSSPHYNSQSTIKIGAPGKGNLFRFCSNCVRLAADVDTTIENNTFSDFGSLVTPGFGRAIVLGGPSNDGLFSRTKIYNNFIGKSESDPYFGLRVGMDNGIFDAGYYGIINWGTQPVIKGNIINASWFGIHSYPTGATKTGYLFHKPEIGGTDPFTGSLCNGLEQNCIYGHQYGGIYNLDTTALNDTTLFTDNDFTGGNGPNGDTNIEQLWYGLFEIASSNYRRTDLTGTTLTFPTGTKVSTNDFPSSIVTSGIAINTTCLGTTGVSCPSTGHTTGTLDNTHIVVPSGQTASVLSNVNNWFRVTEYIFDGSGNKVNYNTFKFDQPHFSSPTFTFDGDSTDNVINTGTSRVIDTQTYTDRGEPWTDKPLATRNIATGDIGRFQIMEVEYVDANPILQEDGSYIITVDSTEALVPAAGTTYFNDGTGTASGGMSKLATAVLANGKTSFREAINVANNFDQPMEIKFSIPESDAGFINPDGSRNSPSQPSGTYPVTPLGYWTIEDITGASSSVTINKGESLKIDGYSIPGTTRNTAAIGETFNANLRLQINLYWLNIEGSTNLEITGLNLTGHDNSIRSITGSNTNLWVHGNYFGTHIDGTHLTVSDYTNAGGIRVTNQVNGLTIGTNGDGINDRGEFNLIGGLNQAVSGLITIYSSNPAQNIRISGNYMFTDKTGNSCSPFNGDRAVIETGGTGQMQNAIIGSNLDGIADADEGNVMGCINTNYRAFMRIFSMDNSIIAGNYIGISPSGVDLRDGGVGAGTALTIQTNNNLRFSNNIVKSFDTTNSGAISLTGTNTDLQITNNRIIGGTVALGAAFGESIIEGNTFENYTDIGGFVASTGSNITFKRNNFLGTGSIRKVLHLGSFATGELPPTPNDSGDSDTGPNNLMNYPEIHSVTYLSGGKYKVEGILDNNVDGEGPFDIEICLSDNHSSGHGGCTDSLGYFENVVPQISGGLNPWSVEVTVDGDNGTQDRIFTSLATNNLGSTSEFGENFNTQNNSNFNLQTYPITLLTPTNNQELTNPSPLFNWEDSGDLDLKHYEVYLNDSFYALVPANQSDIQAPLALPVGTYNWYVVGVRENNTESGSSNTQTFKILPKPQEVPSSEDSEVIVSFPVVQPITSLPPVSFIPREDEIPTEGISSITQDTLLAVTLAVLGIAFSAGAIVFIRRKWF